MVVILLNVYLKFLFVFLWVEGFGLVYNVELGCVMLGKGYWEIYGWNRSEGN